MPESVAWDEYEFAMLQSAAPTTFTVYKMAVRSRTDGVVWHTFWSRFSELHAAFAELRERHAELPQLPEKKRGAQRLKPAFVARRGEALCEWLNAAKAIPAVAAERRFRSLVGEEELLQKLQEKAEQGRTDGSGTSFAECDRALARLAEKQREWASLPAARKVALLEKIEARVLGMNHDGWGADGAVCQGVSTEHQAGQALGAAESLTQAAAILGTVRSYLSSFRSLASSGRTAARLKQRELTDGGVAVTVFPTSEDVHHPEAASGFVGEVHLKTAAGISSAGPRRHSGRLCVVLGAGNQSFLAVTDALYMLFVESCVVALKYHPLRTFNEPYFREMFADLSDAGYFWATEDTARNEIGRRLLSSPVVAQVHMTGGVRTHDAIVWGSTDEEQKRNKAAGTPALRCPMSSELGCITPWIVTPSAESWTEDEISHHAGMLAMAFSAQASANCLSPKVLVLDSDWPQCEAFLDALRRILSQMPVPPPYYPGTSQRYQAFLERYPPGKSEQLINRACPTYPPASGKRWESCPFLLCYGDDKDGEPYSLQNEAFAPVLGVYKLHHGGDTASFLCGAVDFCNDRVWGTLSATLIVHDSVPAAQVDSAVQKLRYGCVAVNTWTASGFACANLTWGAYPGEKLDHVASGIGVVRNGLMLQEVVKSVLRGPFMAGAGKRQVQLRVNSAGKHLSSVEQMRASRQVMMKASVGNVLKYAYHEVFSAPKHTAAPAR
eukprot:TRINITY_DN1822_c0_g1_i1.p1 TRINITY_DN1822_c0_g1~~TRINITY_DN1822_c0_g1_i1.p1  ORF type:complete len:740 (+),score=195.69 TRINITY_DN1822_c0_g1_i1:51-2222(+)